MDKIAFFTAIKFQPHHKTRAQSLLENVDNYFYLGGRKAHVIKVKGGKEKAVLSETNSSVLARVAKAVSYLSLAIPLILLLAKAILRSQHTFRLLDPKKNLEKGIQIPEGTLAKIKSLMPKILEPQKDSQIKWLSTGNFLVFKLAEHSNLVFKIAKPNCYGFGKLPTGGKERTDQRFANMIKAKEVCLANQLGLLVVPHAKKITINAEGKAYSLIAEEYLDFNPKQSAQEELYHTLSKELNPTLRQLAAFIAKTGFNDVIWRNIPLLNETGHKGPKRVGLIDIEHLKSKVNGFIGDPNGSCGLIRCVEADQIDFVIGEAKKQGVDLTEKKYKEAKALRLKELQTAKELKLFYQKRGITKGDEPIAVEDSRLDFSKYPDPAGLKKLCMDLIKAMNTKIAKDSPQEALKGRRFIYINPHVPGSPFYAKDNQLLNPEKNPFDFKTVEEYNNATWLGCAVNKLIEIGAIFELVKRNGHGYFIQA